MSEASPRGASRSALLLGLLTLHLAACGDDASCPEGYVCTATGGQGTGGNGGNGGSEGSGGDGGPGNSGGASGGGGNIDPGCIPSLLPAGLSLPAACGIFVSAGTTGDGSQADPMGDLGAAFEGVPAESAVYICGDDAFSGTFTLAAGHSVFGGLSCLDWRYDPNARPKLLGNPDSATLTISGSGSAQIEDLIIEAPDALVAGGSSIGVAVEESTVEFARCEITAGNAADGGVGDAPLGTGTAGSNGTPGGLGCLNNAPVAGATPVTLMCGANSSVGGRGGDGTNLGGNVANGTAGDSDPQLPFAVDNHGNGQTSGLSCSSGTQGADGTPGIPGAGATGVGAVSVSGFTPSPAQGGLSNGLPGQGGGGGGGARGATGCADPTRTGHAGGGGGTGGCGGQNGEAGQGGGASIAMILVDASISIVDTFLMSAAGGSGGDGSPGQPGGGGGQPGIGGGSGACPGGLGGSGGRGGAGGGGLGGHSLGIAVRSGDAPSLTNVTTNVGPAGSGGLGGDGGEGNQGGDGEAGKRCLVLRFDTANCQVP